MKLLARGARAFAWFWWDFLIGDTPELFFATGAIVVAALLTRHHGDLAVILLPAMAVVFLVASTIRGRKRTPDPVSSSGTSSAGSDSSPAEA